MPDTGIVRYGKRPKTGEWVCLCRHPEKQGRGHLKGQVIDTRRGAIEPFTILVETGTEYIYGNERQVTALLDDRCPYDDPSEPVSASQDRWEWQVEYIGRGGRKAHSGPITNESFARGMAEKLGGTVFKRKIGPWIREED